MSILRSKKKWHKKSVNRAKRRQTILAKEEEWMKQLEQDDFHIDRYAKLRKLAENRLAGPFNMTLKRLDDFVHLHGCRKDIDIWGYKSLSLIYPGIYLSGLSVALDIDLLVKNGITSVLRIMAEPPEEKLVQEYKEAGIELLFLKQTMDTKDNISKNFDASYSFIIGKLRTKEDGTLPHVLVHCLAGVHRSVTIVIMFITRYLFYYDDQIKVLSQYASIYELVRHYISIVRRCIDPPDYFLNELKKETEFLNFMQSVYEKATAATKST